MKIGLCWEVRCYDTGEVSVWHCGTSIYYLQNSELVMPHPQNLKYQYVKVLLRWPLLQAWCFLEGLLIAF